MARPLPSGYTFGKVVGQAIRAVGDGPDDPDYFPEAEPIAGKRCVLFTPKVPQVVTPNNGVATMVMQDKVECDMNPDGRLVRNGDDSGDIGVWLYTGVWTVAFTGVMSGIQTFDILITEMHADVPFDLFANMATPIPPSDPVTTLVVPSGGSEDMVLSWIDGRLQWVNLSYMTNVPLQDAAISSIAKNPSTKTHEVIDSVASSSGAQAAVQTLASNPDVVAQAAALAQSDAGYLSITLLADQPTPFAVPATVAYGSPVFGQPAQFGSALGPDVCLVYPDLISSAAAGDGITVEGWFRYTDQPTPFTAVLWSQSVSVWVGIEASGKLIATSDAGNNPPMASSAGSVCDGAWHHVVMQYTRTGGMNTINAFYLDGVAQSVIAPRTGREWDARFCVGGFPESRDSIYVNKGALDEFRVSRGLRYAGEFAKPTAPFTLDTDTILLAHLDTNGDGTGAGSTLIYPPRPQVAPGRVVYVGPEPSDQLAGDRWYEL